MVKWHHGLKVGQFLHVHAHKILGVALLLPLLVLELVLDVNHFMVFEHLNVSNLLFLFVSHLLSWTIRLFRYKMRVVLLCSSLRILLGLIIILG